MAAALFAGRSRFVLASWCAALAIGSAGCAAADRGGPAPGTTRTVPGRSLDVGPAERAGPPAAEGPRSIRLPSGRVVPVDPAGTDRRGLLRVPDDIARAGWWRGGARIGDPFGSTLVAGHLDATDQGLGPFAELLELRGGQRLLVRSRHLEQTFTIRSRTLVRQGDLRDHAVIYSVRGQRRLTLVTCAPPYLPGRGGYQNLAVVTAVAGDVRERGGP